MRHVLRAAARRCGSRRWTPPRRPTSCWVAHTGLDHLFTVADVWRELPLDSGRPHAVVAGAGGRRPARVATAQIDWLYTWWERIDAWIEEHRPGQAV